MKKTKRIISCLAIVGVLFSCFVSCDLSIKPSKPPDIYKSYVQTYYSDVVNIGLKSETDYWHGDRFDLDPRSKYKICTWDEVDYTTTYYYSSVEPLMEYRTDYYLSDDKIKFGISVENNQIVYVDFSTNENERAWYEATPIENPDSVAIERATEYLQSYSRDISDYELTVETPKTMSANEAGKTYNIHAVKFTKKPLGKYSLPDSIRVRVTSSGDLVSVNMQGVGKYDDVKAFEEEPVYDSIDQKLREVYSNLGYNVVSYTFGKQHIGKNPHHSYCLYSNIDVVLEKDSKVYTTAIVLITILGYKL